MDEIKITQGGLLPNPSQTTPTTVILTAPNRFGQDIEKYMHIIRSADNIDYALRVKLFDLYTDILMDAHLAAVIQKRKSAILTAPIQFQRGGVPDDKVNEQIRSPWFFNYLGDLWDTILQGFSLFQFTKENGWISYQLVNRKNVDPIRQLIRHNQTDINGTSFDEFYNLLFVGDKRDLGLLAKAAPYVIYKRNTIGDWSQFSEIFGMPIREYIYDAADEETRQRLTKDAMEQGGAGVYIHPENSKMNLIESQQKTGSADVYGKLADFCNAELSKLILGNTLTTEAGDKGTQALGTVQQQGEKGLQLADRQYILNILNYQMADIFAELGINTQGGEFIFLETEDKNITTQLQVVQGLVAIGLPISDDYLYKTFGIEKPDKPIEQRTAPSTNTEPPAEPEPEPKPEPAPAPKENASNRWKRFLNSAHRFFGQAPNKNGALNW